MNKKAEGAKEYTSYNKMKDDRFKHSRMTGEVTDKYKLPMTASQKSGFYLKDQQQMEITKQKGYPIKKCPETLYADEMVKTGFLFS